MRFLEDTMEILVNARSVSAEHQADFRHIQLSMEAAERQRPSSLKISAIFLSRMATLLREEGVVDGGSGSEQQRYRCFDRAAAEYNEFAANSPRCKLGQVELAAIRSMTFGVCKGAQTMMKKHLDRYKWAESAFSVDIVRQSRWLLGASGKNSAVGPAWHQALTMTEDSQSMFVERVIFLHKIKKQRLSSEAFINEADVVCLQSWCLAAMKEARYEVTGVRMFTEEAIRKAEELVLEGCRSYYYLTWLSSSSTSMMIAMFLSSSGASLRQNNKSLLRCGHGLLTPP